MVLVGEGMPGHRGLLRSAEAPQIRSELGSISAGKPSLTSGLAPTTHDNPGSRGPDSQEPSLSDSNTNVHVISMALCLSCTDFAECSDYACRISAVLGCSRGIGNGQRYHAYVMILQVSEILILN